MKTSAPSSAHYIREQITGISGSAILNIDKEFERILLETMETYRHVSPCRVIITSPRDHGELARSQGETATTMRNTIMPEPTALHRCCTDLHDRTEETTDIEQARQFHDRLKARFMEIGRRLKIELSERSQLVTNLEHQVSVLHAKCAQCNTPETEGLKAQIKRLQVELGSQTELRTEMLQTVQSVYEDKLMKQERDLVGKEQEIIRLRVEKGEVEQARRALQSIVDTYNSTRSVERHDNVLEMEIAEKEKEIIRLLAEKDEAEETRQSLQGIVDTYNSTRSAERLELVRREQERDNAPEGTALDMIQRIKDIESRGNIKLDASTGDIELLSQIEFIPRKETEGVHAEFANLQATEPIFRDLRDLCNMFPVMLTIEGHTMRAHSKAGPQHFMEKLALRRAELVESHLADKGVPRELMTVKAFVIMKCLNGRGVDRPCVCVRLNIFQHMPPAEAARTDRHNEAVTSTSSYMSDSEEEVDVQTKSQTPKRRDAGTGRRNSNSQNPGVRRLSA